MNNKSSLPRRSTSLNIYKAPQALELPRFHSKQKKSTSAQKASMNHLSPDAIKTKYDDQKTKLTKAQMNEIVTKIKDRQFAHKNIVMKKKSYKKITAFDLQTQEQQNSYKNFETEDIRRSERVKSNYNSDKDEERLHKRNLTNQKQKVNGMSAFQKYRSKSLKNSVKLRANNLIQGSQKSSPKMLQKIIKKHQNQPNKNKIPSAKLFVVQCAQITTESTQTTRMCEIQIKNWKIMHQIFLQITLDIGNLNWPQQYIVMDKSGTEKKFYQFLQQTKNQKAKSKIRKHICISRVCIYLYASLILNEQRSTGLLSIFKRLLDSFSIIYEYVSKSWVGISAQSLLRIDRNNQFTLKGLLTMFLKKDIPHQSLLKNMLQSSLKIESGQFVQILDKTLKWEILKMPSFPYLPPSNKELHLVLDLDQTLIHYDHNSEVFHVRPFAQQFLKKLSLFYEITIFTAALQQYADEILEEIDPDHCISYKLYRNHLTYIDGNPIKDLSMLGRPLPKTIIVDNLASNFRLQPQNGIHINSWYNDDNDVSLGKLYGLLKKIHQNFHHDVRIGIKELSQFINEEITKSELIYELRKEL